MEQIEQTVAAIRGYDYEQPRTALVAVEKLIRETYGNRELRERIEKELAKVLESDVSLACKQFICRQLWIIGTDISAPALEKTLLDPDTHVAEAACYAVSRRPGAATGRALRNALDKIGGAARIAVINLLGDRRDAASAARLAELAAGPDDPTAEAAIVALGKIASRDAVQALTRLHTGQGKRQGWAAHALLESAQRLAADGKAREASTIREQLGESDIPHIRRGAKM